MSHLGSAKWRANEPHVVHELLDGEVVLINMDTGSYYSLQGVGADAWTLIETGAATTDEIIGEISGRYDGDRLEVEQAVVHLIEELRQEGVIVANGTGAAKRTASPARLSEKGDEKRKLVAPTLQKY